MDGFLASLQGLCFFYGIVGWGLRVRYERGGEEDEEEGDEKTGGEVPVRGWRVCTDTNLCIVFSRDNDYGL